MTRAYLFVVLQSEQPLAPSSRHTLHGVDLVTVGRGPARAASRDGERHLTLRVPDPWMSSRHATLTRVLGKWVVEDAGSRNGTLRNGEPAQRAVLEDGDLIELGRTFFLYRDALPPAVEEDLDGARGPAGETGLRTMLPSLAHDFEQLAEVARSSLSVVLRGESGTGKEVVARAIHRLSARTGSFVAMNCGALPDELVETELFGHRKGAFSGAHEDRPGLVRAAHGGTLFLDEIGDLPPTSQAAFLRVLQEREVTPVGATRPIPVDLRLVAATHRDLDAMVAEGSFRADLLARITGYTVHLPPLCERREDLGLLVATLLRRAATTLPGKSEADASRVQLSPEAARALFLRAWPLNVRELEKALATAVVLARGGRVEEEHLQAPVRASGSLPVAGGSTVESKRGEEALRPLTPDEGRHRDELDAMLRAHAGNVSAVARELGKARMQVQRWMRRYRLDPERYRR